MQPIAPATSSRDEVILTQGLPTRFGSQLLALGDTTTGPDSKRRVDITLGTDGDGPRWQSRVVLRDGDVFPTTHAGFLRMQQLLPGDVNTRPRAIISHAIDAGGIAPPSTTGRVLVRGGRVRFAGHWIEVVAIEGDACEIEFWPTSKARSQLADDAVQREHLKVGDTLDMGADVEPLHIERVQPEAGEVLGFVVFTGTGQGSGASH